MRNWVRRRMRWVEDAGIILTDRGKRASVAFRAKGLPGIAITYIPCGKWSITHDPSGYGFPGQYELLADAIDVAEDLCPGFDWTGLRPGPGEDPPHELAAKWQEFFIASLDKAERLELLRNMP